MRSWTWGWFCLQRHELGHVKKAVSSWPPPMLQSLVLLSPALPTAGQINSFLCLVGSDKHKAWQCTIGSVGTLPKASQAPELGSLHREPSLHFQRAAGKLRAARMHQGTWDPKEGKAFRYTRLLKWHYIHNHVLEKLLHKWTQTSSLSNVQLKLSLIFLNVFLSICFLPA